MAANLQFQAQRAERSPTAKPTGGGKGTGEAGQQDLSSTVLVFGKATFRTGTFQWQCELSFLVKFITHLPHVW